MLFCTFAGKLVCALVSTQMLSQAQCCVLLGIELLTEIKHMTHLEKMPHMEQLEVGTRYERLSSFVEVKPATLQIDKMMHWTVQKGTRVR